MLSKPSDKWIKIIFISLLSLIVLSMFLIVNSYFSMEKRINQSAEDYLEKTNNYAISILEQSIKNYSILFKEQASDLITDLERVDKEQMGLKSISKVSKGEIEGIFLLDDIGNILNSISFSDKKNSELDNEFLLSDVSLEKFLQEKKVQNGKEYYLNGYYYINLYAYNSQKKKILVVPVNLQRLYKNQIKNGKDVFRGYSNIKNEDMVVIMHPSDAQINLNFITDRKKLYPKFNFDGLEKVEQKQKSQKEGIIYYDSYWWDQNFPTEAEKLSVFKWIGIGDSKWVVSTNSDIEERKGLPIENVFLLLAIFLIIVIIFILFIFILKQYQNQYNVYLKYKESEERREEDQLRHELEKRIQQESKLETIGIVSTTIAHDLNNILTPLIGITKLMMEEHEEDRELQSDLESIYNSAKKGQELSSNVLRFSKLDNKKKTCSNIETIVRDGINTIEPLIPKNVQLDLQIKTKKQTTISIDPQDLQNILFNLITNAYQAIGDKKGLITISILKEKNKNYLYSKTNEVIIINVIDDGPGIPEKIQNKVLTTPFYTTKGKDGGTGLGLFVVTSLVKKYGWFISLTSNKQGTIFSIRIPI